MKYPMDEYATKTRLKDISLELLVKATEIVLAKLEYLNDLGEFEEGVVLLPTLDAFVEEICIRQESMK